MLASLFLKTRFLQIFSSLTVYKATSTLDDFLSSVELTDNHLEAEVILVGGKKIDLSKFPKLKGIFKCGVGTDNLPFDAAKENGILIQLPSEKTRYTIFEETSNFACHLIMQGMYSGIGSWDKWYKAQRNMLSTKKLLVIGSGNIGGRVASKMSSFMLVTTYDTEKNHLDELPALIEQADCISLHIPLTDKTKGFFDTEKIRLMKKGAILVNTARGPIVKEECLYEALKKQHIKAIFDVFWEEPYLGKLMEFAPDRFIVSPHVASTCKEFVEGCANDFLKFLKSLHEMNNKSK